MYKTTIRIVRGIDRLHITKDDKIVYSIVIIDGCFTRDEAMEYATEYAHGLVAHYESFGWKVQFKQPPSCDGLTKYDSASSS
jgi:hypothetical protein